MTIGPGSSASVNVIHVGDQAQAGSVVSSAICYSVDELMRLVTAPSVVKKMN